MPRWNNPKCGFQKGHKKYGNPQKQAESQRRFWKSEDGKKTRAHLSEVHTGKTMTQETRQKMSEAKKGKLKKDNVGYGGVHMWLKANYGKASCCEGKKCYGKSKTYQWAKIAGKNYERKRENFIQLCASCHRRYDFGKEKNLV